MITEAIGWTGNIMLAICCIPQALKCYRNGHSKGLDHWFLWLWYLGEMGAFFYHCSTSDRTPQIINYIVNITAISVIVYYRYFPREENDERITIKDN